LTIYVLVGYSAPFESARGLAQSKTLRAVRKLPETFHVLDYGGKRSATPLSHAL